MSSSIVVYRADSESAEIANTPEELALWATHGFSPREAPAVKPVEIPPNSQSQLDVLAAAETEKKADDERVVREMAEAQAKVDAQAAAEAEKKATPEPAAEVPAAPEAKVQGKKAAG